VRCLSRLCLAVLPALAAGDATPPGQIPGVDEAPNGGVLYLTDGSCGAECMQWGFAKKAGAWKLVWAGPVWVAPKP